MNTATQQDIEALDPELVLELKRKTMTAPLEADQVSIACGDLVFNVMFRMLWCSVHGVVHRLPVLSMSEIPPCPYCAHRVFSRTDPGLHRKDNEDSILIDHVQRLYAVADGMGGHRSGKLAAERALQGLAKGLYDYQDMTRAMVEANRWVLSIEGVKTKRSPGSTLTAVWFTASHKITVGHVGDSELYLYRKQRMTLLTRSHNMPDGGLYAYCGQDPDVFDSEVTTHALQKKDKLLICSDGLGKHFRDIKRSNTMAGLMFMDTTENVVERMVEVCNERGGKDNISVVLIEV